MKCDCTCQIICPEWEYSVAGEQRRAMPFHAMHQTRSSRNQARPIIYRRALLLCLLRRSISSFKASSLFDLYMARHTFPFLRARCRAHEPGPSPSGALESETKQIEIGNNLHTLQHNGTQPPITAAINSVARRCGDSGER